MDVEVPKVGGRVRVRLDGYFDPLTQCHAFRVEDWTGRVLRRIRAARNCQEALALYWRCAGAAMPGVMMSKDLERRISRARAGGALHQAMQTPELPFATPPPDDDTDLAAFDAEPEPEPDAEREAKSSALQIGRSRARRAPALVPQTDLFPPEASREAPPETHTQAHADETRAEPSEAEPAEAMAAAPARRRAPRDSEPRILSAETVMLQRVDFRQLRPTDRADSYLYHITNGPDAEVALRQGLVVSASDPMILTERQGVSYWLSVLAEDYDYIMDGPADFVVLRLRRIAVEELLEPDPDATRSAGCPCYLLTGRRRNS